MAQTTEPYTGNGTRGSAGNALSFTFPYLKLTDVKVSLNGTTLATTKYTFPTATTLQFNTGSETTLQATSGAPKTGVSILIYRDTDVDSARHVFGQGSAFKSQDLNENKDQSLYFDQEVGDTANPKNFVTSAQISDGTSLSAADKTKLDTIETSAKDDQTGAEIKTLYEGESNTNAFTDAEKTKLGNVETNAKDDQTAAEIKSLYESNSQTNAFTDAEKTKLQGVEDNAKDDQTASEIKSLYESNSDTNAFTDNDHTKLDGIESNAINASNAAITGKLPLTGGTLTGALVCPNIQISHATPLLTFTDTNADSDFQIKINGGIMSLRDQTNSADRLTINSSGLVTVANDLTVSGNFTVSGTNTTIDTTTLNVEDKNIELGKVSTPTDTTADGGGLTLKGATDKTFQWLDATDSWTSSEHIALPDNKKLQLGASQDLQIFHDGYNSYIRELGTGYLFIESSSNIYIGKSNNGAENCIVAKPDNAVELYYDNSKKLETTSTGTLTTGFADHRQDSTSAYSSTAVPSNVIARFYNESPTNNSHASITLGSRNGSGSPDKWYITCASQTGSYDADLAFSTRKSSTDISEVLRFTNDGHLQIPADNAKLQIGASQDFEIFHDGTQNILRGNTPTIFRNLAGTETTLKLEPNGAVKLYYDTVKKLETTSTGATVTGVLVSDGIDLGDDDRLRFGVSQDLQIYHNGSDSWIYENGTGNLNIGTNNSNIFLKGGTGANETFISCATNGAVELYHDNLKKFETTSIGCKITDAGANTALQFINDNGGNGYVFANSTDEIGFKDNATHWLVRAIKDGAVELYHNNVKKFETTAYGNLITAAGAQPHGHDANWSSRAGLSITGSYGGGITLDDNGNGGITHFLSGNGATYHIKTAVGSTLENAIEINRNNNVELYYDNSKKLETTPNGIDITGSSTFAQQKLKTSDGTNRGGLYASHNNNLFLLDGQDNQHIQMVQGGEVIIKHNNNNSIRTYATGVQIFGALFADSVDLDDNQKILIGTGDDLQIFHNGTDSFLKSNTGDLRIQSLNDDGNIQIQAKQAEESIIAKSNGAVELYYDNSKKFETTSTGATVTTTSAANSIKNITTSTSAPSGGSDGDLWFTYVA